MSRQKEDAQDSVLYQVYLLQSVEDNPFLTASVLVDKLNKS